MTLWRALPFSVPFVSLGSCLIFGLAVGAVAQAAAPAADPEAGPSASAGAEVKPGPAHAKVVSVYDGDTFTLDTGDRVRLRWVNTPEVKPAEPYAVEAREAAKALVLNRDVELIYGATPRDGYGRLLAGVRVGGQDLTTSLLEQGLGHLFVIPPDATDLAPFVAAQDRARKAGRGIWGDERFKGELHITSFHANADGDDRSNLNGEYVRVCNLSADPLDLAGYKVTDLAGRSWTLPSAILPPGATVKIQSGKGETKSDPDEQIEVFLGSDQPIWNNQRDRITLYDRYGRVVDAREHEVAGGR